VRLLTDCAFDAKLATTMAGLGNTFVFDFDNNGRADVLQ
jgi:hypothetical protein